MSVKCQLINSSRYVGLAHCSRKYYKLSFFIWFFCLIRWKNKILWNSIILYFYETNVNQSREKDSFEQNKSNNYNNNRIKNNKEDEINVHMVHIYVYIYLYI